jgi:Protein of unknown function (DUF3999)
MSGKLLALCCALLCVASRAHAQTPSAEPHELRPNDFAFGRVVQLTASDSALVELELPVDVYRGSRSADLKDLWVFNAGGEPVPQALRRASRPQAPEAIATLLPLFPVLAEHFAASLELSVAITRGPAGQLLQLHSRNPPDEAGHEAGAVAAYVLDARALDRGVTALRFEWFGAPDQLILPLTVESSEDLLSWSPIAVNGVLLHLEHDGHRVDRDRIEMTSGKAAFFRVRPLNRRSFPAPLRAVFAELVVDAPTPVLERLAVRGQALAARSGVYRFDLGGPVPVERLEVELPEDNTVIAAELWSAEQEDGQYQRVAEARIYRVLADGQPLIGPSLTLFRQRARYYELRVDGTRAGIGAGMPTLVTYHSPDLLLFLRRGAPPFTLAYGRHGVLRQRFEADDLLALLPLADSAAATPARATLGDAKPLGGVARLLAPKPAPPYGTYALWAGLLAGVALLAAISYRLVRGK